MCTEGQPCLKRCLGPATTAPPPASGHAPSTSSSGALCSKLRYLTCSASFLAPALQAARLAAVLLSLAAAEAAPFVQPASLAAAPAAVDLEVYSRMLQAASWALVVVPVRACAVQAPSIVVQAARVAGLVVALAAAGVGRGTASSCRG